MGTLLVSTHLGLSPPPALTLSLSLPLFTPLPPQSPTDGHSQRDESLLEALNSTETSASASPLPQTPPRGVTLTRITDYPGHTLSQSPPGSIRRSSLSVSESSLTSSFTSDTGSPGQPRKRILKKLHGPRKHKSNRVHWNIPEEGGGDGVSLLSFESTSTMSGLSPSSYLSECRRNWREFEEPPAPGSTGLTPMKQLAPLRENLGESVDSTPLSSSESPPRRCPHWYGTGTSDVGIGQKLSPLYYSTQSSDHTSTPLRRHSDSSTTTTTQTLKTTEFHNGVDVDPAQNSAHSSLAPPPVLRLDHSNLSELEASTFEDRAKSNLFAFPSVSNGGPPTGEKTQTPPAYNGYVPSEGQGPRGPPRTEKIPTPPAYSGYIPPEGQAHLCGGSDADDYDHLSPESSAPQTLAVANTNVRFDFFPRPSKTKGKRLTRLGSPPLCESSKNPEKPPTPVITMGKPSHYRENDIDEALNELTDSASSRSGSSAPQSPLLGPSLTGPLTKLNLDPGDHENDDGEVPPPVPPKLNRRKSNSPTARVSNGTVGLQVPPGKFWNGPPEFATGPPAHLVECAEILSEEGGHEDALSSVSTATLVPSEQGDSVPHSAHSGPNGTNQRSKHNHSSKFGAGISTTDYSMVSVKTRTSVHVHPEIFPPHSSSAPTHQSWDPQWKGRGTTSFAPHPPPLPYHQPLQFVYPHESQLHCIEENANPERQALISISNSGSDSSLRGASPPEKISQTSVIPTSRFDRNFYVEDSLSQPLPARPLSASTSSTRGVSTTTVVRAHPQAPRFNHAPLGGSNMMSRNHRLYHSHRSGLAPRARLQKIPAKFYPQPVSNNQKMGLKFQYSLDSLENKSSAEVPALTRTYSPPFQPMALSQDDPPLGTALYPPFGGLVGGRGLLPRPRFRSTDRINQRQLRQNYPFVSQGHTHKPHPSQVHPHKPRPTLGHTHHQPHPLQAHHQNNAYVPQLLKQAHSMTEV